MRSSGFESGLTFQTLDIDGVPTLRRFSPSPATSNSCSCAIEDTCADHALPFSNYICRHGRNCTAGKIIWTVPGIANACIKFDVALSSDFRCLFNQSCIDQFLQYYNVDIPDPLPLPQIVTQARALNTSQLGTFSARDTMSTLAQRLLVVEWELNAEYENY
jgi:hypothetical protein